MPRRFDPRAQLRASTMYGDNRIEDVMRVLRATATDQLARFAPAYYVRLTEQTGRGADETDPAQTAEYFRRCFSDYFDELGIARGEVPTYLADKTLLEYGPGDLPGVALLMYAHGAAKVICVDRFPLVKPSAHNLAVVGHLLDGLDAAARARAQTCFNNAGDPASGWNASAIDYRVRPSGLSGLSNEVDLVFSRAVLEHVDDLEATFGDMTRALRRDGIAIHKVDLRSHGLHRRNPLDFLTWPMPLWHLMYAHKGVPNRWRIDRYRLAIEGTGLMQLRLHPDEFARAEDIDEVLPRLAKPLRGVSRDDLSWLGFWVILQKAVAH